MTLRRLLAVLGDLACAPFCWAIERFDALLNGDDELDAHDPGPNE